MKSSRPSMPMKLRSNSSSWCLCSTVFFCISITAQQIIPKLYDFRQDSFYSLSWFLEVRNSGGSSGLLCPMRLRSEGGWGWNAGKEATGANEALLCSMWGQSFSMWSFYRCSFELPHGLVAWRHSDCWHGSQGPGVIPKK